MSSPRQNSSASVDTLSDVQELRGFLGTLLQRWPDLLDRPVHYGASLFIDIAGFTAFSEMLAARGPEGAEILEHTIRIHFDALLEEIEFHGGIPIKFSGDAISVIFPEPEDALRSAARRAVQCALALQKRSQESQPGPNERTGVILSHKIGVGTGMFFCGMVGDPRLHTEVVFVGEALDQAGRAEQYAAAGEIWLSPATRSYLQPELGELQPETDGFVRVPPSLFGRWLQQASAHREALPSPPDCSSQHPAVASYHPVLQAHAMDGTLNYMSRHQTLTVLFAGFPELRCSSIEAFHRLDAHYRHMQRIVSQFGGFLSELDGGDKGPHVIVLFGAPAILDDPFGQAALCAQAMQQQARSSGLIPAQHIGIASGRLYVGRIGCRSLMKYSALGDRMNLAARLMCKAPAWAVLAERLTIERSSHVVRWGRSQLLQVKGKEEGVVVRRLVLPTERRPHERRGRQIIGRYREKKVLSGCMDAFLGGKGCLVQLSGPPGIGKTRLLEFIKRRMLDAGVKQIGYWNAFSEVSSMPFAGWKFLVQHLIALRNILPADSVPSELLDSIQNNSEQLRRGMPASGAILTQHRIPDPGTSSTQQTVDDQVQMLVCLFRQLASSDRIALLWDNADLLDEPSLRLLLSLLDHLSSLPILIALANRDGFTPVHRWLEESGQHPGTCTLQLGPFTTRQMDLLASRRLRIHDVHPQLEHFLQQRAQGNPHLIEAWVDVLRDQGQIRILNRTAYLRSSAHELVIPDQLESLILKQLERLPPAAQFTVRVASVIGLSVSLDEVQHIHPQRHVTSVLQIHLTLAMQSGLIWADRYRPGRYFFSRSEVHQVLHDSLPFSFRRELHARCVFELSANCTHDLDDERCLALARHYEYIEIPEAQLAAFAQASKICRSRFDFQNALRWSKLLLLVADRSGNPTATQSELEHLDHTLRNIGVEDEAERLRLQREIRSSR